MNVRILLAISAASMLAVGPAHAGRAFQESGQALMHSANAVGHTMVGATQLVSGVVAVPFKVAGSISGASAQMGDALWQAANAPIGEPLPIAEESVTAGPPPSQALSAEDRRW